MKPAMWDRLFVRTIGCVAIGAVVLAAHWPVLRAQALSFDDDEYLVNNRLVQNPSFESTGQFLAEVRRPSTVKGYYQPLAMISLMLDAAAGGSPTDLVPFHRTSLLLHLANSLLLAILLYRLFHNWPAAVMVGVLFGTHPLTVEPLAWVADRKTTLATCFCLICILLYLRYTITTRWTSYALCLMAFLLAILSKPTAVPLALGLLVLDYWPLGRLSKRAVVEKLPFFLLAAVSACITVISQQHVGRSSLHSLSAGQTFLLACHNLVFYPGKMIWPVSLAPLYEFPANISFSNAGLLGSVLLSAVITLAAAALLRWTRAALASWAFFCLMLSPTLLNKSYSPSVAWDKYAYLPAMGLLFGLCALLGHLLNVSVAGQRATGRLVAVLVVVAVACGLEIHQTRHYLGKWCDTETLVQHMVALAPHSAVAHDQRGNFLLSKKRYAEAEAEFLKGFELDPTNPVSVNNLGMLLHQRGRYAEAIRFFKQAVELEPRRVVPLVNLANALVLTRQPDQALACYSRAVELEPGYEPAYTSLSRLLALTGKREEALDVLRRALVSNGGSIEVRRLLAEQLGQLKRWPEAVPLFRELTKLEPRSAVAHNDLGAALFQMQRADEAAIEFGIAVQLDPRYVQARVNLGTVLLAQQRFLEAVTALEQALALKPDVAQAHNRLGYAFEKLRRMEEAITHYRRATELDPRDPTACWNLAEALNASGRFAEAIPYYQRTLELQSDHAEARQRLEALSTQPSATGPTTGA